MRCLLLSFCFLFVFQLVQVQSIPGFTEKIQECKNKTNANEDETNNVLAHRLPETENEKCLLACIEKKIEFLGDDNKANLDKILKNIEPIKKFNEARYEKLKKIYEDCVASDYVDENECTAAFNFAKCVNSKQAQLDLFPNIRERRINIRICANKTGANDEEQRNVVRHEIPKTKNEECMLACVLKKDGYMTPDNKMYIDKLKESFITLQENHPDKYKSMVEIYEVCKAKETEELDECIAAKKFAECIFPKERLNRLGNKTKVIITECINKINATDVEIDNVLKHEIPKTSAEKCLFACIEKKLGTMKDDNTMDIDKMKSNYDQMRYKNSDFIDEMGKILDDCKAEEKVETDECLASAKFAECVYPKEKELRESFMHRGPHRQ